MSLFSALTVAVGGLNAQSRSIGHISDNISNATTVGYKRVDTRFEALVTQSNLRLHDPGGVRASPVFQNSIQGNLLQSQVSTSLAISGNGFFAVRPPEVGSSGSTTFGAEDFYTRRGDFKLDREGYLVNGANNYLIGWSVDAATQAVNTSSPEPVRVSQLLDAPVPTTQVQYRANLPAGVVTGTSYPTSTINVFDSLGNPQSLELTWTKNAATNEWGLNVQVDGATTPINNGLTFAFNTTTNQGTIATITPVLTGTPAASPFTVVPPVAPDNFADVTFPVSFAGAGSQTISLRFGSYNTTAGVTQFADSNVQVTTLEQNGIPRGSFRDLTVDDSGFVVLNYDNGRSRTLYQIPIVQFNSPDSLNKVSGGSFSRSLEAGTPRYSAPGTVGAGSISGNTLEGSNVDIADEFTKMIQTQRIYSANAKIITTANEMLQEAIATVR